MTSKKHNIEDGLSKKCPDPDCKKLNSKTMRDGNLMFCSKVTNV